MCIYISVDEHRTGQLFVGDEGELRVNARARAAMAHTPSSLGVAAYDPADPVGIAPGHRDSLLLHLVNRCIRYDLLLIGEVRLQVEHAEADEIMYATVN